MTFERLIAEYERVSNDLKISTLLAGLPKDICRYLPLQVSESTTREKLRETMLARGLQDQALRFTHHRSGKSILRGQGSRDPVA